MSIDKIELLPKEEIMNKMKDGISLISKMIKQNDAKNNKKNRKIIFQPMTLKNGVLKQYQLQALRWMVDLYQKNMNGILADDMGLGKTIQTLSFIAYLQQTYGIKGKHLIVAPKNVLRNWERQAKKWTKDLQIIILPGTQAQRQQILTKFVKKGKFDILIVTYQSCQSAYNTLQKKFIWQTLVIDQAHSIKNQNTVLGNTLRMYRSKFTLLLTGTPLSNKLQQLWSLLNFIMPHLFSDQTFFRQVQLSVNSFEGQQEEKIKYQCQIAKNFKKLIEPFMMRRTKNEMSLGLKQKKQMTLYISLTELQLKMYRNYLKFKSVYGQGIKNMQSKQMQLRKICSHPYIFPDIQRPQDIQSGEHLINNCGKLKLLDKLLKKFVKENHKILIFSQFTTLLVILQDYCFYRGYKYSKIDGSSSLDQRQEQVQKFDNDANIPIFLISTRAGGLGLNLTSADIVILYDIDWNPQMDKQAMDRSYRIGQKNSVQVFKLVSANTIEQRMIEIQKYKLLWDELVIQKGGLASLNQADSNFQKINYDKLINLGAEQIFKIQQNLDQKNIQQIIRIGQEKDQNKMKKIKDKLQKDFEKYGKQFNPYQQFQAGKDNIKDISYDAAIIKHKNAQQKQDVRQIKKKRIILQDFKFYKNHKRTQALIYKLLDQQNQDIIQQIEDKLRQQGFYDWTQEQYNKFILANMQFFKDDFNKIQQYIGTKKIQQIMQYSDVFYQKYNSLINGTVIYKKIIKYQNQLTLDKQILQLQQKIKQYDLGTLQKDINQLYFTEHYNHYINLVELQRLNLNTILYSGVSLQQCKTVIQDIMPIQFMRYKYKSKKPKKFYLYYLKRIIADWENKNNRQVVNKFIDREYDKLIKQYLPKKKEQQTKIINKKSDKTKVKKVDIFQQKQSQSGTEIAYKMDSVKSYRSLIKTPPKIESKTKVKG